MLLLRAEKSRDKTESHESYADKAEIRPRVTSSYAVNVRTHGAISQRAQGIDHDK
jgi:hypothetical protein